MNEYKKMFFRTSAKVLNQSYESLLEDLIKTIEEQSKEIQELKEQIKSDPTKNRNV